MKTLRISRHAVRSVLLSGAAAIALAALPVSGISLDLSVANAQGAGKGSGGENRGGSGGGGERSGGGGGGSQSDGGGGSQSAGGGGAQSGGGGSAQAGGGGSVDSGGGKSLAGIMADIASDEDSDRPDWAGVPGGPETGGGQPSTAGTPRGDLYGDLWVILRDDDGIPILTEEGWVQPLDAEGNLIPLDEEGMPIDETLTQEVELGRLNVGRAPTKVLNTRADEVITILSSATDISLDPAGRLVLTVDGEEKTIDSPLENLAIYVALMTQGTIPGVSDLPGTDFDFMVDGEYTTADLAAAASFLAAASDKTGEITTDEVAYIDAFLGINLDSAGDVTWSDVDYSDYSYDRSDTYSGVLADVLVQQSDGTWEVTTVDIYNAVFNYEDASGSGDIDAFSTATDDALSVIEFIHEYAVPE